MMTANHCLKDFVQQSLERKIPRTDIQQVLLKAGWASPQIESALNEFSDIEYPLPVPKPILYISARDTFLYLILFSTLYSCVFNLGSLVFEFINYLFPDPAIHSPMNQFSLSRVRWSLSSILISFPVFLFITKLLSTDTNPNKRTSKIRKWMTYITLFFASSTLICDLTYLVYNFSGGGLAIRFLLKHLPLE
jgi:hypothetical protein